jgi:hypothetical protein
MPNRRIPTLALGALTVALSIVGAIASGAQPEPRGKAAPDYAALATQGMPTRFSYPRLGPPWPTPRRPSWLSQGTVFVGNWEPLQWAYRKNWQEWGNTRSGKRAQEIHELDRTEATVAGLKKLGVNMVFTSFHKGFGIENEKFNMDEAREYGKLLHKYGIRMAVYVSALLIYEDLYGEFPESKEWHRVLHDGTPDTYWRDGYRYRAYLNHPAYVDYMKRVCELAVKAGADAIFFDTVRQPSENHHPLAERMFREWLKQKYPNDRDWFFRTGLRYRDFIKIPHYSEEDFPTFDHATVQEYMHFKAQQIADFAAEFATFIHGLNPETAIWFNTGGVTGGNTVWLANIDHARLLPWLDMYYTEERDNAEYTEKGGVLSKIRTIKAGARAASLHTNAVGQPPPVGERSLDPPRDDPRLRLAEAMAFSRVSLGNIGYGARSAVENFPQEGRRYIQFFWKHQDLLRQCLPAADVAVLRSFPTLAFNSYAPHREVMLAEQALIQAAMPFDILFDEDLSRLPRYKVLVLADQECLSDAQVEAVRAYVKNGGGLVVTGQTAAFDDWRRQREGLGLADVLGIDGRASASRRKAAQHDFGKGRAAYVPRLGPAIAVPARTQMVVRYWAPPTNAAEFLRAVRWAGAEKLDWDVQAPPFVAAEAYHQPERGRYLLHLVNYNCWKQPAVTGVRATVRAKSAGARLTVYSPDEAAPATLRAEKTADGLRFALPKLGIYSIVVIEN